MEALNHTQIDTVLGENVQQDMTIQQQQQTNKKLEQKLKLAEKNNKDLLEEKWEAVSKTWAQEKKLKLRDAKLETLRARVGYLSKDVALYKYMSKHPDHPYLLDVKISVSIECQGIPTQDRFKQLFVCCEKIIDIERCDPLPEATSLDGVNASDAMTSVTLTLQGRLRINEIIRYKGLDCCGDVQMINCFSCTHWVQRWISENDLGKVCSATVPYRDLAGQANKWCDTKLMKELGVEMLLSGTLVGDALINPPGETSNDKIIAAVMKEIELKAQKKKVEADGGDAMDLVGWS
jgi:hypothetical protein